MRDSWWPTALQKSSSAWPFFPLTFVVIGVMRAGLAAFDATWVFVGLAVLLAGHGVLRGRAKRVQGLPLQSLAVVGVADHHRVNKVVTRSMAELCGVLDTLLALSILIATLRQ
jgi:hypothetical protein